MLDPFFWFHRFARSENIENSPTETPNNDDHHVGEILELPCTPYPKGGLFWSI